MADEYEDEPTTPVECIAHEEVPLTKYDSTKKISEQRSGNLMGHIGSDMGNVVGVFYQAGRDAFDTTFVVMLIGVILGSGIGDLFADFLSPLGGSLWGLILLSAIVSFQLTKQIVS